MIELVLIGIPVVLGWTVHALTAGRRWRVKVFPRGGRADVRLMPRWHHTFDHEGVQVAVVDMTGEDAESDLMDALAHAERLRKQTRQLERA